MEENMSKWLMRMEEEEIDERKEEVKIERGNATRFDKHIIP
jgi:hypothetical protein